MLAVFVLAVSGLSVKQSKWDVVRKILFEDKKWKDLLSERVRLNKDQVPLGVRDLMTDYDDVDPLITLHKLVRPEALGAHYSGSEMTLGTMIVETAVSCMTLKRTAVYIALALRLTALESEKKQLAGQASVFAHIIPYSVNALPPTDSRAYDELMSIYDVVTGAIVPDDDEKFDKDKYVDGLAARLLSVNAIVADLCMVTDVNEYFNALRLPTVLNEQLGDVFADGHQVSEALQLATVVALLRDNENAMLDAGERLSPLAEQDVAVVQGSLKAYPKTLPECFVRTAPTGNYREAMAEILREKAEARAKSSRVLSASAGDEESLTKRDFNLQRHVRTVPIPPKSDVDLF